MLHIESESEEGAGSISEVRLRETIDSFLRHQGYQTNKVDALFTGIVERVVALVSRVQGTFEFEVQPLREYFAARYLHDTAPYSPSGDHKNGALPDRFDGLARNFYWLNVTRFFAGCYSSGELSSLIDGLDSIELSEDFRYISHIPEMRVAFVSDHVFSQQPRLVLRLIQNNFVEPTFSLLLAKRFIGRVDIPFALPPGDARDRLLAICKSYMEKEVPLDRRYAASSVMYANMTTDELNSYWINLASGGCDLVLWAEIGSYLNLIERLDVKEALDLYKNIGGQPLLLRFLWSERFDIIEEAGLWTDLLEGALSGGGSGYFIHMPQPQLSPMGHLYMNVSLLLSRISGLDTPTATPDAPFWSTMYRQSPRYAMRDSEERLKDLDLNAFGSSAMASLWLRSESLMQTPTGILRRDPEAWSSFIEQCRVIWGDRWVLMQTAAVVAHQMRYKFGDRPDIGSPILVFACRARRRASDLKWWENEFSVISNEGPLWTRFFFLCLFLFAPEKLFNILPEQFSAFLNEMPEDDWVAISKTLNSTRFQSDRRGAQTARPAIKPISPALSGRLAYVLMLRRPAAFAWKEVTRWFPNPWILSFSTLDAISDILGEIIFRDDVDWKETLPYIEAAHAKKILVNFGMIPDRSAGSTPLPLDVATYICSNGNKFPLELLDIAETTLAAAIGAKVLGVGDVAAANDWFAEW